MTKRERDPCCGSQDECEWGKSSLYKVKKNTVTKIICIALVDTSLTVQTVAVRCTENSLLRVHVNWGFESMAEKKIIPIFCAWLRSSCRTDAAPCLSPHTPPRARALIPAHSTLRAEALQSSLLLLRHLPTPQLSSFLGGTDKRVALSAIRIVQSRVFIGCYFSLLL